MSDFDGQTAAMTRCGNRFFPAEGIRYREDPYADRVVSGRKEMWVPGRGQQRHRGRAQTP